MNNSQVAHNFAYGKDGNGSNFYSEYSGTLLYSYSSLMARKFGSIILVDKYIANYSNTSQRHHSHLYRACNHMDIIYVSELDKYGRLEEFLNQRELNLVNNSLIELYKKQQRARKRDYSYEINKELYKGSMCLCYGKIDKRSKVYKIFMDFKNGINPEELIQKSIEEEKKRNKLIAKQQFKNKVEQFERFTKVKCPYTKPTDLQYNWIRIEEDKLKTNSWVSVPLDEAIKLYRAFKKGIKVVGQKIDHYTILSANKDLVQIGCHKILVKELDRVLGE
jgi:hypothetical protein